jgi:hypothetical protein
MVDHDRSAVVHLRAVGKKDESLSSTRRSSWPLLRTDIAESDEKRSKLTSKSV